MVESCSCYSLGKEVKLPCDVPGGCFRSWVDDQTPAVPEVFLKSLGEESND